ncbi:putative Potassium transport protein [Seiridium cardinale]
MSRQRGFARRLPLLAAIRPYLPPLNFITVHYMYFVTVCLLASVVFYGSSNPRGSISYADSLFLVISAMSEAGLNTVNLSQMTTWQQVMLWLLIILGSQIWVSIWTVLARKHVFEKRFKDIARRATLRSPRSFDRRRSATDIPLAQRLKTLGSRSKAPPSTDGRGNEHEGRRITAQDAETGILPISGPVSIQKLREPVPRSVGQPSAATDLGETAVRDHITFADTAEHQSRATATGIDTGDGPSRRHVSTPDGARLELGPLQRELSHHQFLTAKKVGRNAQFHDLTHDERETLGGTEYRALKVLSIIVPLYFFSWQILGCVALGAWITNVYPQPALSNAINPWWNGIFNGVSAFNNSGMSVLDANMIPYGSSYFVLIVMGAMVLAGNTAYPVFLRFWLWSILKLLNLLSYETAFRGLKDTLEYILKYPRRVYTNLFPSRANWWLLFMLFMLNGTDWVAFEILNLGNTSLEHIPVGSRILDGLFQAIAVRSGGFYVVSIPTLYIGLQVLYVIMMYISVYPVVITMRHSNVYEERSLGIYADDVDAASVASTSSSAAAENRGTNSPSVVGRLLRSAIGRWDGVGAAPRPANDAGPESHSSFISHQVRGQLSHDLWLLVLAVLLISTIETSHFLEDPATYSVFNIIFEVVSAYGCVGVSVGVPYDAFSFSGGMYTGSKLVLCLVMLRGRHRGLPVALDRAVRLPGDELGRTEEEDHRIRRSMSMRRTSTDYGRVGAM